MKLAIFSPESPVIARFLADIAAPLGPAEILPEAPATPESGLLYLITPAGRAALPESFAGAQTILCGGAGPVRAGALRQDIAARLEGRNPAFPKEIRFGPYTLNTHDLTLTGENGTQRVTEKEVAILATLAAARPGALARDALLDRVWGYADGIETHTLETHIYRLRQKIEADPAAPTCLMTTEEGYVLAAQNPA